MIPEGWRDVPLGDLFDVKHGFAFPGEFFTDVPAYPTLLTPGNFAIGGGFKAGKARTFSGDVSAEYILRPGSLVLTMTDLSRDVDTLGLPALVPDGPVYLHNQRIGLVVPRSDQVWVRFLNYLLRTKGYRSHVVATATGSTVRHTSPSRIKSYRARVPGFDLQRAIAEVLGALDDKIAANTKLASTAEDLARTLASAVPATVPLGEIVEHIKTTVNPEGLADDSVAHFSLPAFDAGIEPEVVGPQEIKSNKFLVREPSVLVSKLNPRFPRVWNVRSVPSLTSLASTEFVTLRPRFSSTTVLWALTSQPAFGSALEAMVAGTSGSHQRVKPAEMLSTLVPDPRTMSDVLVGQIDGLGLRAISSRDENRTLAATRDTLLPQLMSGKLRVRDAERIASEVA
ncbi:restriction endonuclease subunit S [Oerskovia sp. NPDC060287]|uniref:restriction endonuclease subunit S n=1 Tax=Oerskovia sp. NPDC060287 TaxID=3347095 RepID=UPI00364604CB